MSINLTNLRSCARTWAGNKVAEQSLQRWSKAHPLGKPPPEARQPPNGPPNPPLERAREGPVAPDAAPGGANQPRPTRPDRANPIVQCPIGYWNRTLASPRGFALRSSPERCAVWRRSWRTPEIHGSGAQPSSLYG